MPDLIHNGAGWQLAATGFAALIMFGLMGALSSMDVDTGGLEDKAFRGGCGGVLVICVLAIVVGVICGFIGAII